MAEFTQYVSKLGEGTTEARTRRLRYFEYLEQPTVSPRHRAKLLNQSLGLDWETFACHQTHNGDPSRRIHPQQTCDGAWWQVLASEGKNLTLWGCTKENPCKGYLNGPQFFPPRNQTNQNSARVCGPSPVLLLVLPLLLLLVLAGVLIPHPPLPAPPPN